MNRRSFLAAASVAAATLPYRNAHAFSRFPRATSASDLLPSLTAASSDDDAAVLHAAIEAARAAGARYADVQLRITQLEEWWGGATPSKLDHDVGCTVRVFHEGCWGAATLGGIATMDEAAQLGREAAGRALMGARRRAAGTPVAELAPLDRPATGEWVMPGIDPLTVTFEEKADFLTAVRQFIQQNRTAGPVPGFSMELRRECRLFASSDNALTRQTIFRVGLSANILSRPDPFTLMMGGRRIPFVTPAGAGWEYLRTAPFRDRTQELIDLATRDRSETPINVGRYDIVFDAYATASLIGVTLAPATELDRVLGFRANDEGTSYVTDPVGMRGSYRTASPLVTLTANRTVPGGAATVRWDDEGVAPTDTPIVDKGILSGFQTTRESAAMLGPGTHSNGCAGTYGATMPVGQVPSNVTLAPSATALSFDEMVKDVKKGLAVYGGVYRSDQQALNGYGGGDIVLEIVDGKCGRAIGNAELIFRAPEVWKSVARIGGSASACPSGLEWYRSRGDASGSVAFTVSAVPVLATGVAVTDRSRARMR